MLYGGKINLAKLIVERLREIMRRKSIPICYGMHLMKMMAQAGVNLQCTGEPEYAISSAVGQHTLKELGYRYQHGDWEYVGQGRVDVDPEGTIQIKSAPQSQSPPSRSTSFHHVTQTPTLTPQSESAHLRQFIVEQLHLMQATILSKLDSIEIRVQACEEHLNVHPCSTPTSHPPTS